MAGQSVVISAPVRTGIGDLGWPAVCSGDAQFSAQHKGSHR
jgi:hypothetical protein